MKIDLSEIESGPRRFNAEVELDPDDLNVAVVEGEVRVRVEGTILPVPAGFSVNGRFSAHGTLQCSRCLEPVTWTMDEDFGLQLSPREHAPKASEVGLKEDDLEVVFLDDSRFDLTGFAAEQVMLGLPMRVVCDEKCAGLCPRCGGNRNTEGGCRCEPEVDPRWDGLKGLSGR